MTNEDFVDLTLGKSYIITYSQLHTQLLGKGYDTKCYEYDLDYEKANYNMRSDCLAWTYQDQVNKICGDKAFVPFPCLIRDETFEQVHFKTIGSCLANTSSETVLGNYCLDNCPRDCDFRFYSINSKESTHLSNHPDRVEVLIEHINLPDILIKSLPEITFISFVSNFGGLLGMWLGISILVICQNVCNVICRAFSKRPVINVFNMYNMNMIQNTVKVSDTSTSSTHIELKQVNSQQVIPKSADFNPVFIKYNQNK